MAVCDLKQVRCSQVVCNPEQRAKLLNKQGPQGKLRRSMLRSRPRHVVNSRGPWRQAQNRTDRSGSMMEPEPLISFLGIHLQPGKSQGSAKYLTDGSGVESTVCLHITQAALGDKPKTGRNIVYAVTGKDKFAVGTLEVGRVEQFSLDLMLASDVSFQTQGPNEVYLTGYKYASQLASCRVH